MRERIVDRGDDRESPFWEVPLGCRLTIAEAPGAVGGRITLRELDILPAQRCFKTPMAAFCRGTTISYELMRSDKHGFITPASHNVCLLAPGIARFLSRPTTP